MRQHGVRQFSERDRRLLRFVGEQTLIGLPQLAHLAGRSERTGRWLRTRWERAGLAEAQKFAADQQTVLWATGAALRLVGLPYHPVRPDNVTAARALPVVELRWAAERQYPGAEFVPRRELASRSVRGQRVPDALIRLGETELAILLEPHGEARDWHLEERLHPYYGRATLLLCHPDLTAHAEKMTCGSQITVVEWRWLHWRVNLPELPPLRELLPDAPGVGWPSVRPGEVAAAPSPEWGAAATEPVTDDEEWWLEPSPVLDPGRSDWYQGR